MRYIDSGARNPDETLGAWIKQALSEEVTHIRFQTGFYALDGLALVEDAITRAATHDLQVAALLGSNEGKTLRADVEELAHRMGVPRPNAKLGVIGFRGGFFHPKVYHFERVDGSQVAYVGSANLTQRGLESHVEAGVILDSRNDDVTHLNKIAGAIDWWFAQNPPGLEVVGSLADLNVLEGNGVLATARPARISSSSGSTSGAAKRPALARLLGLQAVIRKFTQQPPLAASHTTATAPTTSAGAPVPVGSPTFTVPSTAAPLSPSAQTGPTPVTTMPTPPVTAGPSGQPGQAAPTPQPIAPASPTTTFRPVVTRPSFPGYLLFEPNATQATVGVNALTGTALPNGASGLIVKLNRDSGRHFLGGSGTSNVSLPVTTVSTLRFGVAGIHSSPTAAFDLEMRFISNAVQLRGATTATSVKGYGYTATETGHGDIRMVITAEAKHLKSDIIAAHQNLPTVGSYALLEWPTNASPSFKITFLDPQSSLHAGVEQIYQQAEAAAALIGGAAWLQSGIAPAW